MNTRPIEVQALADGEKAAAELMICDCGGELFLAFKISGQNHPHLQCMQCGESYCTGERQCVPGVPGVSS